MWEGFSLPKVRLFAAFLPSWTLSWEYSTQEACLIAQRLPENGNADCELTPSYWTVTAEEESLIMLVTTVKAPL